MKSRDRTRRGDSVKEKGLRNGTAHREKERCIVYVTWTKKAAKEEA